MYITGTENVLTITPIKAKFGLKKDYLTLVKQGFTLFEFVPVTQSIHSSSLDPSFPKRVFNWQEKQSFVLNAERSVELLPIKLSHRPEFGFEFEYTKDETTKRFEMKSDWQNNAVKVSLQVDSYGQKLLLANSMTIPEFLCLQKMIDFSLPYMMGWQILGSAKIGQEDFLNEPIH